MTKVLSGFNRYGLFTGSNSTPIEQVGGLNLRFDDFNLELSTDDTEIKAFNAASIDGKLETLAKFTNSRSWTLTLQMVAFNWIHFQHLVGEYAQTTSNYKRWAYRTGILDADGVLTDDALAGKDTGDVRVTLAEDGVWGQARQLKIVTATVSGDQIQLDGTAKTLTNASFANAPIDYWIQETEASIETIGVQSNPKLLTDMSFEGTLKLQDDPTTAGIGVKIPKMAKNGGFSLQAAGGETKSNLIYTPTLASGYRSIVEWYRLT